MAPEDDRQGDALSRLTRLFEEHAAATGAIPVQEPPTSAPVSQPTSAPVPQPTSAPVPSAFGSTSPLAPEPVPPTFVPAPESSAPPPPFSPPPLVAPPLVPPSASPPPAVAPSEPPTAVMPTAPSPGSAAVASASTGIIPPAAAPPAAAPPAATPPAAASPASADAGIPPAAPAFGGAPLAPLRSDPAASPVEPVTEADALAPGRATPEATRGESPSEAPSFAAPVSAATAPPLTSVLPRSQPDADASAAPDPVVPTPAASPASAPRVAVTSSTPAPAPSDPASFSRGGPLLPPTGPVDDVDETELARSTLLERIVLVVAVVLPPIGLIASIVAAVGSARRRGWVITLIRASIAVGVVLSVVTAGLAYAGYKAIRQQQAHDQTVAASAPFCAAFVKDKTLGTADGGWPQPAASVPASVTAMQAFVTRWTDVAKIAPAGIRPGVATIAAAGTEAIGQVQVSHTVDDATNRTAVQSAVAASGVADWRARYCG